MDVSRGTSKAWLALWQASSVTARAAMDFSITNSSHVVGHWSAGIRIRTCLLDKRCLGFLGEPRESLRSATILIPPDGICQALNEGEFGRCYGPGRLNGPGRLKDIRALPHFRCKGQAACGTSQDSTRALSSSNPARPYIRRLMAFSRLICPSMGPLLHGWLSRVPRLSSRAAACWQTEPGTGNEKRSPPRSRYTTC
jgi:hypothetical protein